MTDATEAELAALEKKLSAHVHGDRCYHDKWDGCVEHHAHTESCLKYRVMHCWLRDNATDRVMLRIIAELRARRLHEEKITKLCNSDPARAHD